MTKKIQWQKLGKDFLRTGKGLPKEKFLDSIQEKTGIRPEWKNVLTALNRLNIEIDTTPNKEQILQNLPLEERKWNDPEILEVNPLLYDKGGVRVGNISRIDFFSEGFRKGIIKKICEIFCSEGVHWVNINAGLIDKRAFQQIFKDKIKESKDHLKKQREEAKKRGEKFVAISQYDLKNVVEDKLFDEAAKALAAMFPKLKKPGTHDNEFIRYYITTSNAYDGTQGNEIARRLQALRPDDIRHYKPGSARTPIKGLNGKTIWSINPARRRLASKYQSAAAEIEISEKEKQTSQNYPDIWIVGAHATAVYTPSGTREVPYMTLPAASRLEGTTIAENQVGLSVLEYPPIDGRLVPGTIERLVRVWSFRDLIANERKLITGIKEGSKTIHKRIVEKLKESGGAVSVGLIDDELGIHNRDKAEKALKFLEETEAPQRKTWPGLYYEPSSQLYDFHLDWIQQRLRYILPKDSALKANNLLFFGCMHAGYTTVDYEFIVKQFPEIMLRRNTQTLVCLGDIIAGLHHNFLCTGEIFSGLNNTDQEIFAAELVENAIFKVFKVRFENMACSKDMTKLSPEEIRTMVNECLVLFLIICGNHDLWQEIDGNTPIAMFLLKLKELLTYHISLLLEEMKTTCVNIADIVRSKIIDFPDYSAYYQFKSGLGVAMAHPQLGRASTTSLRAEHAMGMHNAQITGIANFHTATVVHKWKPDLGQCVTVQVGTSAIYTRFEARKMKRGVDFGPISLRTLSHNGRILMTETGMYDKPILTEAIPKSTDINILKKKLGL